jgi:hypothetical protein
LIEVHHIAGLPPRSFLPSRLVQAAADGGAAGGRRLQRLRGNFGNVKNEVE